MTTQLFISQFAVRINNCDCCHYTKFTQVLTQVPIIVDNNLPTMIFLSFGQTDQGKNSADPEIVPQEKRSYHGPYKYRKAPYTGKHF